MTTNGRVSGDLFRWVLGLVASIALALSGFTLKWTFNAHAELLLLRQQVEQLAADDAEAARRDRTLSRHWRLLSHHRDQITTLRQRHELAVEPWPDLGDP